VRGVCPHAPRYLKKGALRMGPFGSKETYAMHARLFLWVRVTIDCDRNMNYNFMAFPIVEEAILGHQFGQYLLDPQK
jgi:hypothetical protein